MPDPHFVCGVQLRPFCIGHWQHLQRCEISFAVGGEHTLNDLLLAVLICSKTYEDFAGSLQPADIMRELSAWHRRLSGGFLGVWKRRMKWALYWLCNKVERLKRFRSRFIVSPEEVIGFNVQAECKAFEHYIAEHGGSAFIVNDWSRPVTEYEQEQTSKPLRAPELMVLLNALTAEQGFSESEARKMPLPKARWERAIFCERKGLVSIVSPQDAAEKEESQRRANEHARKMEDPVFAKAFFRGEVTA